MTDNKLLELIEDYGWKKYQAGKHHNADTEGWAIDADEAEKALLEHVASEYVKKSENITHVPETCVNGGHVPAGKEG